MSEKNEVPEAITDLKEPNDALKKANNTILELQGALEKEKSNKGTKVNQKLKDQIARLDTECENLSDNNDRLEVRLKRMSEQERKPTLEEKGFTTTADITARHQSDKVIGDGEDVS